MNGEEALLAEVRRQAEGRREGILAEARARVEEIRRGAEEEVRRLEVEASRVLEARIAADTDRILGRRLLERQNRSLAVRSGWLRRAFDEARRQLASHLASDGWPRVLERLSREALRELGGEGELEVAQGDEALLRHLPVTVRSTEAPRGTVLAVSADRMRRVDNSLDTRLRNAERALEGEVARLLFGAQG